MGKHSRVPRSVVLGSLLLAATPCPASVLLELTVEPPAGTFDQTFTITIANTGDGDFPFDGCCSFPRITSLATGQELPLCILCAPCPPEPRARDPLPPGGFLQHLWRPADAICTQEWSPAPGVYEARWGGFPQSVVGRFELRPDPQKTLPVSAAPSEVRIGEEVRISLTSSAPAPLFFPQSCECDPHPMVLDPLGLPAFCPHCPDCFVAVELDPGGVLSTAWNAGISSPCREEVLPGRYRIIWGGTTVPARPTERGEDFFGETRVLVLPPLDRHLELSLSQSEARPGDVLQITARNPLEVPIWYDRCCDEPLFIDELGHHSCFGCAADCAGGRHQAVLPGETISTHWTVPGTEFCGLRPGRWSVVWGRNFGLAPGVEPSPPVFGYAEVTVLPAVSSARFLRGNCDGAGRLNITDPIYLLHFLFLGGAPPGCLDSCDTDDTGRLDLSDAVMLIGHLFLGGAAPQPPYPEPGPDPTLDRLTCRG